MKAETIGGLLGALWLSTLMTILFVNPAGLFFIFVLFVEGGYDNILNTKIKRDKEK